MATNFEFYKEYLVNNLEQREGGCICSEIDIVLKYDCYQHCSGGDCGECWRELFKYLAQEHIEQPKLTKRERAFCEAVQTGWIARDVIGGIYWYENKPKKGNSEWISRDIKYTNISVFKLFNFINWEDEKPWAVTDLLKLEVMEDET